jgi:signal transduction histidine kinase
MKSSNIITIYGKIALKTMKTEHITQLEEILESVSIGIVILSASDLRVRYANTYILDLATELWGPQEIQDRLLTELIPEEISHQIVPVLQLLREREQEISSQEMPSLDMSEIPFDGFLKTRGRTYWNIHIVHKMSANKTDTSQKPEDVLLLIIENITDKVHLHSQIEALHKQQEQATLQEITRIKTLERAREDFFTTMAHELKTPLANIRAHLSALQARDMQWTNEQQYAFLQTADQQVERLVGMINHFLDASRVEAGALRLEIEPILLPELFEDMEERLEALISSSNKRLVIRQPKQLPAVRGDYELIMSVLTNLLSNAFRYTPEGEAVELTVATIPQSRRKPVNRVKISVTDHGPGISKEMQAELFTRFSTFAALNRPSSESPGQPEITRQKQVSYWSHSTGLGLYISRGIVEAHGSHLQVVSSPGQGAIFAFELPIYSTPEAPQMW